MKTCFTLVTKGSHPIRHHSIEMPLLSWSVLNYFSFHNFLILYLQCICKTFKMFELERSEIKPNSSHDLSSVIHELHWIKLTVVVVYVEVITILFMVKRETCNFPCVSKGLWNSASCPTCLSVCLF